MRKRRERGKEVRVHLMSVDPVDAVEVLEDV